MRAFQVWYWLTIVSMPKAMQAGTSRCYLTVACRTRSIREVNGIHRVSNVQRSWLMWAVHNQCHLVAVSCCCLTSLARSSQPFVEAACRWWWSHATTHARKPLLMLPISGRHHLCDVNKLRKMSTVIGWCLSHFTNVHISRVMRAGLCWCRLQLADVACLMPTCHIRCVDY